MVAVFPKVTLLRAGLVRRILGIALALMVVPATVKAVTVRDIIALSNAGVADVILTALIDADRTIFTVNAEQILELRDAGVSETVMLKMIGSRQEFGPPPSVPIADSDMPPPGAVVASEPSTPAPIIIDVPVPYLVSVPVDAALMFRAHDYLKSDHHAREPRRHAEEHGGAGRRDADVKDHRTTKAGGHRGASISAGLRIRNGEFVR